eukprot:COSAG01_NODE_458_length_16743_cov_124.609208_7_plen_270_part_00
MQVERRSGALGRVQWQRLWVMLWRLPPPPAGGAAGSPGSEVGGGADGRALEGAEAHGEAAAAQQQGPPPPPPPEPPGLALLMYAAEDAQLPLECAVLPDGGFSARPPQSARKGAPHCLRLSVASRREKHILAFESAARLQDWVHCLESCGLSEHAMQQQQQAMALTMQATTRAVATHDDAIGSTPSPEGAVSIDGLPIHSPLAEITPRDALRSVVAGPSRQEARAALTAARAARFRGLHRLMREMVSGRFHIVCGRADWDLPICCVFLS